MRTLIIDNYDSFTFNLYQYIAEVNQEPPVVIKNDDFAHSGVDTLEFDNVVISPGPGRPDIPKDFGLCTGIILRHDVPILGVCLGHQGIGHLFGGRVLHAPQVMHGRASLIHHRGEGVFRGLPSPFSAIRYHSLIVDVTQAADIRATARTADGVLMGLQHRSLPIWGVQFHPESICTEHGMDLLRNFRDLSMPHRRTRRPTIVVPPAPAPPACRTIQLRTRRLGRIAADAEAVFCALYANKPTAFWLDSSLPKPGLARFSFMGDAGGPLSEVISYDSANRQIRRVRNGGEDVLQASVFDHLHSTTQVRTEPDQPLPFQFHGGWVGYLGYELKQECGGEAPRRSPHPDAAFIFVSRFIAFDHEQNETWVVEAGAAGEACDNTWLDATAARLAKLYAPPPPPPQSRARSAPPLEMRLRHGKQAYLEAIQSVLEEIDAGESYEVCLTNQITVDVEVDGLSLHRVLRRTNPAPFAAYLRFGKLQVISASPERFLRVDRDGRVEAKPIKGTARRGATAPEDAQIAAALQADEKSRAENLMIVDLLRNDIGAVCDIGTVAVPKLMAVETYATVHQLVSTVTGRLAPGVSAVECVRRAFPGGSMTGAPKIRTLEILDRLEEAPRGIYSGAIGYFALGGAADLNIVIRTIVSDGERLSMGVGGAIVALSDPEAEYEETLLKARAQIKAILLATGGVADETGYRLIAGDPPARRRTRANERPPLARETVELATAGQRT